MSDAGTSAGAGTAGAGAGTGTDQWFAGLDADTTGHIQNRGWDKLPVKDAAAQAIQAHRAAEKLLGVPAEQLLRMPKDANDTDTFSKLYEKLGVPGDKAKYDFTAIERADKSKVDDATQTIFRDLAFNAHLNPEAATAMAREVIKVIDARDAKETADYALRIDQERAALKANWGSNAATNQIVAENAAAKLGVEKDALVALEKAVGYSKVMEMFRKIGTAIGEDKFITGPGVGGGAMSAEQANATLEARQRDQNWMERFQKNDSAAVQEFHNLTRLIAGV